MVAVPQRRGPRGRVPDAHQVGAGAAPWRHRGGDERHRLGSRSIRWPTTLLARPNSSPRSARCRACPTTSPIERSAAVRGRRSGRSTSVRSTRPIRQTTRALDLGTDRRRDRPRARCCCEPQAPVERRATDDRRGRCRRGARRGARSLATTPRGHRPSAARHLAPAATVTSTGARASSARASTSSASSGDDIELASSLRERGFAEVFGGSLSDAEWLLGEAEALTEPSSTTAGGAPGSASTRRGSRSCPATPNWPRAAARSSSGVRRARRSFGRGWAIGPAGVRPVLPAPIRRGRGARRRRCGATRSSSAIPGRRR